MQPSVQLALQAGEFASTDAAALPPPALDVGVLVVASMLAALAKSSGSHVQPYGPT